MSKENPSRSAKPTHRRCLLRRQYQLSLILQIEAVKMLAAEHVAQTGQHRGESDDQFRTNVVRSVASDNLSRNVTERECREHGTLEVGGYC